MPDRRVLDVTGGEVVTVNLVCDHESPNAGVDGAEITGSVLTAIFTPANWSIWAEEGVGPASAVSRRRRTRG